MRHLSMLVVAFTAASWAPTRAQAPAHSHPLAWLAGCWQTGSRGSVVEEQWMAPRGGQMMGMSRTTQGETVTEYEFIRIYRTGDTLTYAAQPSGQPAAEFKAALPTGPRVVFANPTHDFPQRVIYERVTADSVVARVEGERGGQTQGFSFEYRRVRCG